MRKAELRKRIRKADQVYVDVNLTRDDAGFVNITKTIALGLIKEYGEGLRFTILEGGNIVFGSYGATETLTGE